MNVKPALTLHTIFVPVIFCRDAALQDSIHTRRTVFHAHACISLKNSLIWLYEKSNRIKKNEEHRIAAGHQWVFSNEIASLRGTPDTGDIIELLRHDQKFLGLGFYHPHSLIAFRFLTPEPEEIGFRFFERRIQEALALRQKLYPAQRPSGSHMARVIFSPD